MSVCFLLSRRQSWLTACLVTLSEVLRPLAFCNFGWTVSFEYFPSLELHCFQQRLHWLAEGTAIGQADSFGASFVYARLSYVSYELSRPFICGLPKQL